jgi:hypothetical protein
MLRLAHRACAEIPALKRQEGVCGAPSFPVTNANKKTPPVSRRRFHVKKI